MNRGTACALLCSVLGSATLVFTAPRSSPAVPAGPVGAIRGHIVFTGKHPGNPMIRMGMDPKCAAMNAGKRVFQDAVTMKADGSLGDVFVKLDGTFPETPVPVDAVVVDQRACVYGPRVVGVRVGQTLRVRNDDDVLHNVHSSTEKGNSFNISQPKAGIFFDFKPKSEEVMLRLGCDVHRWMTAFVGVVSHPYFAVSDTEGTFQIAKVPPGTYVLHAWHEKFGEMRKTVTVRAGAVSTTDLSFVPPAAPK